MNFRQLPKLSLLPTGQPDEFDLELLHVGGVEDPQVAVIIRNATVQDPKLAALEGEFEAFASWWQDAAPGLPQQPPRQALPIRRWMTVAAAACLLVGAFLALPQPSSVDLGYRAMGGLPVDIVTIRNNIAVTPEVGAFQEGDRVLVAMTPPFSGYVVLGTVEDTGRVSLLWRTDADQPISGGTRWQLDSAIELDNHIGKEWLVVLLTEEALNADQAREALKNAAEFGGHGDHHFVFEVTRQR